MGTVSICSEFRIYSALEPPEGGTTNIEMNHYLKMSADARFFIATNRPPG